MTYVWVGIGLLFVVWAACFYFHTRSHYARLVDAKKEQTDETD